MTAPKTEPSVLQSVQNGLKIIKLFTQDKPIWGVTEISQALGLSKSTVSRLIGDLVTEGYLQKTKSKYCLGLSLLCLSGIITSHLEINREAKETLHELVDKLEETAHLVILEGSNVTYLNKVDCKHPIRLLSHIGKNNPASCTSSGKVLLAYQSKKVQNRVLQAGLPKKGPNSITDPQVFLNELKQVKKQGYSVCMEELHKDVVSIAAPIRDYTGEVVAAVNVVGPKERITEQEIPRFIKATIAAAKEISVNIGYIQSVHIR